MPPVAAIPVMRTNGQTARASNARPYKPAGNAEPSRDCVATKIYHTVGAGHCPARDPTAIATLRSNRTAGWGHPVLRGNGDLYKHYGLVCRGGINAARCSHPDNAAYRANRTERSRPFPTNLPETPNHHGIAWQQKYTTP